MTLSPSIWLLEKAGLVQYENDLKGKPGKTLIFKLNNKKFLWNIQKVQKEKMCG